MINKKTRKLVYDKYNGHCAYCGCELELKDMQVDHIKPLCRGYVGNVGTDEFENYNPSCRACNFRKGMLSIEQFRNEIAHGLDVLKRDFTYRFMMKYGLIEEHPKKVIFFFEKEG